MPSHRLLFACLTASSALSFASVPAFAKDVPSAIRAAIGAPARADQRDDDSRRKAAALLALSGVKSGDKVVDFVPGSGYWTRIFTGIVGNKGHVYALWPAFAAKFAEKALPDLNARELTNVTAEVESTNIPSVPEKIDLFWTVQNYHDVANGGGEAALNAFNADIFAMLKPGGTYIVIDHADAGGSGLEGTPSRHRIDKSVVISQIEAAGFKLVSQSSLLENPQDDHSKIVFDPSIRGKTDQFVLKFRKP